MSETNTTMNPSTYKQVKLNTEKLDEIAGQIGDLPFSLEEMANLVQDLETAVLEPKEEEDTGLIPVTDEEGKVIGSKVAGLHNVLLNVNVNNMPSAYAQGKLLCVKSIRHQL